MKRTDRAAGRPTVSAALSKLLKRRPAVFLEGMEFDPPMPSLQLRHKRYGTVISIAPGDTLDLMVGPWEVIDPQHPGWTIDNWPRRQTG